MILYGIKQEHQATLEAVFADPIRASIVWRDIEAMLAACGAEIAEGQGSRVRVALGGVRCSIGPIRKRKRTRAR